MPIAAAELLHERPRTQLRVLPVTEPQKNDGFLFVGETTIVHRPTILSAGQKNEVLPRDEFDEFRVSAGIAEQNASNPGFDIGRRLTRLGKGPFTLLTWGNAEHTSLMRDTIGKPHPNRETRIQPVQGAMREAVIFERDDQERIEVSTLAAMRPDFAEAIGGTRRHVIIGALPEDDWRAPLGEGLQSLNRAQTSYTMLLGESLRRAVADNTDKKDSQIVYDAIAQATSLIVTLKDLKLLVAKHATAQTPSDKLSELMEQARVLGPQYVFAVCGREVFLGGSEKGAMWIHADTGRNSVHEDSYMNAFIAGVVSGNTLEDRLLRGSASASLLVEREDQSPSPTEEELQARMVEKRSARDIHTFSS